MVEGARLEIVWARKSLGGSNPLASAREHILETDVFFCSIDTNIRDTDSDLRCESSRFRQGTSNKIASARAILLDVSELVLGSRHLQIYCFLQYGRK